jgi:hypothetical protein
MAPKQNMSFSGVKTLAETEPADITPTFSACGHSLGTGMAIPKNAKLDPKTKIYTDPSLCFACAWTNTKNIQSRCKEKWQTNWQKETRKLASEHAPTITSVQGARRYKMDEEALSKLYLKRYINESLDI